MKRLLPLLLAPGALLACATASNAQSMREMQPKTLPGGEEKLTGTDVSDPGQSTVAEPDAAVLVQALRGVIFVDTPAAVRPVAEAPENGLDTARVPALADKKFQADLQAFLGQPVSMARLDEISAAAVEFYRAHGRPLVDISLPEQDITNGVVQFLVTEGRVGKINVQGERWFPPLALRNYLRVQPGGVVDSRKLDADVEWINRNPFRKVSTSFGAGETSGETDLTLNVKDRLPLRLFAGYENTGTELTGEDRYIAGFNWGRAFGLDHQMNFQYTTSPDGKGLAGWSLIYTIPLPWRHELTLYGSHADTEAVISDTLVVGGFSTQAGLRYAIPLPEWHGLRQELTLGLDFKRTNNNIEFGGVTTSDEVADLYLFNLQYEAGLTDPFGATSLRATIVWSPGGIGGANASTARLDTFREEAKASFAYASLKLARVTRLPWDFTLNASVTAQIGTGALLGSEQLPFGGHDTVRGYSEREINGDQGLYGSLELRTPTWSPLSLIGKFKLTARDELQLLAFLDYGYATNRNRGENETGVEHLCSVGVGLRYTINPYLSLRADYAIPLRDTTSAPSGGDTPRWHLGLVIGY